jgi:hypothetical protein
MHCEPWARQISAGRLATLCVPWAKVTWGSAKRSLLETSPEGLACFASLAAVPL